MNKGLTQRAYAERLGISESRISKLIREGKLTRNQHGRIDPEEADREMALSRDPSRDATRKSVIPNLKPDTQDQDTYSKARTAKELWTARLRQLEYEVEAGKYVDRQAVGAMIFGLARQTRDNLLRIPDRVVAAIAAEKNPRKVKEILQAEIHQALEHLADEELEEVIA